MNFFTKKARKYLLIALYLSTGTLFIQSQSGSFKDPNLPLEDRIDLLHEAMTIEEKV